MVLDVEGIEIVETAGEHGASAGGAVTLRLWVDCKTNKNRRIFMRNIYIFMLPYTDTVCLSFKTTLTKH